MLPAEALQWPMLLDMTKEECQRVLRRLELTAYSGVVSAFRGQGQLSKEKRRLLAELAGALGVPADRHRAEARRAANDEALNTIAHRLAGAGTRTDWAVEGRRVVPVLPRGRPITAYTAVADASRARTERLSGRLLPPADTRSYEPAVEELPPPEISPTKMTAALLSPPPPPAAPPPPPVPVSVQQPAAAAAPHLRPPSPTPGVIRLPSGMSIQLEDELQGRGRKRRRSSSSGDAGPRIHPPPAARTPTSHPQEAYTVRLPPPALPPPLPPGFSPAALPGSMGRSRHPAPGPLQPPGRQGGPRPVGVSASRAPPLPTAVTATATVNTSSGHKVIFVSSSGGAPSSVVACPPRSTPPSSEPGTPSGPGPGVIQGPGGGVMPGTAERRQRPPAQLEPNTDTYRQLAGLDSTGSPLPPGGGGGGPGRARGRGGRRQAAAGPGAPVRNATRVASGVKIITHTVPLAAASGTKVVTKGGGQPVLVMPSSGAAPAAAAAARSGLAVRTAAGGRVVTVSGGGAARPLVHRQQPSLHGYALPRAVHVGRSPSGGSPTSRPPASVIVLQKGAAGRPPTVVRPPRPRAEPSTPAAVFVSAPHAPAPAGRPSVVSVPLVSAPAPVVQPVVQPLSVPTVQPQPQPAAAPVSAQDQQKLNNSSVLSDILHATGIINPKSAQDGSIIESPPPAAAVTQKTSLPKVAPAPHPAPAPLPVPASVVDAGRPPPSSPSREPPQPAPPPPPQPQQAAPQLQQPRAPAPVVRRGPAPAPVQLAEADCSSDTGPSLTLEQAVELLNQQSGDPEQSRQILRQAGIRLAEPGPGTVIATAEAAHQMTGGDRLPSEPGMELVGELDPQTGIFYPVTPNSAGGAVLEGSDLVQDGAGETLEDISAFLQQRHDTEVSK